MAGKARKTYPKSPMRRRGGRRGGNIRRRAAGGVEFASAKQTLQLNEDPVNQVLRLDNINLSQFDRLTQIARAYQYFRITKIEMKFKPLQDTFLATGAIGSTGSVPYFYWLINKSDSLQVNSFNAMRDAGAKPLRFDDKTVNVKWVPSVAQGVALSEPNITTSYATYRNAPWLSTNQNVMLPGGSSTWAASTVPHQGLIYGVQQDYLPSETQLFYGVEITVHTQFKKPLQFSLPTDGAVAISKEVVPKEEMVKPPPVV